MLSFSEGNKVQVHYARNPFALSALSHAESVIVDLAKIAAIVSVTNAWPELGASAVKLIKSQTRSKIKKDVLNSLLQVSINDPAENSKEADNSLSHVVEKYMNQVRYGSKRIHRSYLKTCNYIVDTITTRDNFKDSRGCRNCTSNGS